MSESNQVTPWVSFCISTYKRPSLLQKQLASLLEQSNQFFEIVISDNDPEGSARPVADSFNDIRVRYFQNEDNLGMIKSFNRSIERAGTEYIVMVTDDDPVDKQFLEYFRQLIDKYPGYSLYGGFIRERKSKDEVEEIHKNDFLKEILDPDKTTSILWSSCILKREHVTGVKGIPDFGSPHLADHALLVMTGSIQGGIVVNKMYSHFTFHEGNFSKFNFDFYVKGCKGFYEVLMDFINGKDDNKEDSDIIVKHIGKWFISNIFNLKKYYNSRRNADMLVQIDKCADEILAFPFMKRFRMKYYFKVLALKLKIITGMIKT